MTGLVLAGGGVKGAYQIGAYLALKESRIKIKGVVGTSIGAFNAALIAEGKEKELYEIWKNVDVGEVLGFHEKFSEGINEKDVFKELVYGLETFGNIMKNKGISHDNLKKILDATIDEKILRESNIDFGLVTVKRKGLKPIYMFKKDMEDGKINDYILASCNLPIFKADKLIDDNLYLDGGFYDNNPVNMLLQKGYDRIYSVELNGIGRKRKIKEEDKNKVISIVPSRYLGSTLSVNKKKTNENIKLGFYDTLKIIKNYAGYNFIFKNNSNLLYNILASKVDKDLYKRVKNYFKAKDNKELIIRSLEYIMQKEEYTYFNVYSIRKEIKKIRKTSTKKHFIYEFVRSLRLI